MPQQPPPHPPSLPGSVGFGGVGLGWEKTVVFGVKSGFGVKPGFFV